MVDFYLVVGRLRNRGFSHYFEYKQNGKREYLTLLGQQGIERLMLLHYDGSTVEIIEGKK